jgi:hypothetical protein
LAVLGFECKTSLLGRQALYNLNLTSIPSRFFASIPSPQLHALDFGILTSPLPSLYPVFEASYSLLDVILHVVIFAATFLL